MGDLAFGKSFGMLESPDNRFALDLVAASARRNMVCGSYPLLHNYGLDKVLFSRIVAMRQGFVRFAGTQAAESFSTIFWRPKIRSRAKGSASLNYGVRVARSLSPALTRRPPLWPLRSSICCTTRRPGKNFSKKCVPRLKT